VAEIINQFVQQLLIIVFVLGLVAGGLGVALLVMVKGEFHEKKCKKDRYRILSRRKEGMEMASREL